MPFKEMIDFGKTAVDNKNAAVRTAANTLFAALYKHVGEPIRNFMSEIKESTLKVIEDEFKKATPFKKGEFVAKRFVIGTQTPAAEEGKKGGKGGGGGGGGGDLASLLDDAIPREDISKQINGKLLALFKSQDWKVRKEGSEKVEAILRGAKMRILPNGLNELADHMKQRMTDSNKAVLKCFLGLLGIFAEALGSGAKQFTKKLLPPII